VGFGTRSPKERLGGTTTQYFTLHIIHTTIFLSSSGLGQFSTPDQNPPSSVFKTRQDAQSVLWYKYNDLRCYTKNKYMKC
jgi:hypothetical protein